VSLTCNVDQVAHARIIERFVGACNRGEETEAWSLLVPAPVVWVAGSTWFSGTFQGPDQIRRILLGTLRKYLRAPQIRIAELIASGASVGALLELCEHVGGPTTVQNSGSPWGALFDMAGERIARIEVYPDTQWIETVLCRGRYVPDTARAPSAVPQPGSDRDSSDHSTAATVTTLPASQAGGAPADVVLGFIADINAAHSGEVIDPFRRLAADGIMTVPGRSPLSGDWNRARIYSEFLPCAAQLMGREPGQGLFPTRVIADGERVVVLARGRASARDGHPYNNTYFLYFEVREGRIYRYFEGFDSSLAHQAIFGVNLIRAAG